MKLGPVHFDEKKNCRRYGPGGMRSKGKLSYPPATWLCKLAPLSHLASRKSDRGGGASGRDITPSGPPAVSPRGPRPTAMWRGERAKRGPRLDSHKYTAPQLSLTAFNVVRADVRCRLTDPRQSDVTSL